MTINVGLAAVLAQVAPVFILMLLFQRVDTGAPRPGRQAEGLRVEHIVRSVAATLCVLVFAAALLIVGNNEPATGALGLIVGGAVSLLLITLAGMMYLALSTRYQRQVQELQNDPQNRDA